MKIFFKATVVYLLACVALILLFRDDPGAMLLQMATSIPHQMTRIGMFSFWVFIPFVAFAITRWKKGFGDRLPQIVGAFLACSAIAVVFPMAKTTLPYVNPFWADGILAHIDRALHFGVDPWKIVLADPIRVSFFTADIVYVLLWMIPAIYFPFLLAFFDENEERRTRFSLLYLMNLSLIGLVLAGVFMSGGPIYHDYLVGGTDFAGLHATLAERGIADSYAGRLHEGLWTAYVNGEQEAGSGISAFPSVHIAMATVFALYFYELSPRFLPLSVLIVATYLFFSVYLGWHYAIDGYASAAIVVAAWAYMRRRKPSHNVAAQLTPT